MNKLKLLCSSLLVLCFIVSVWAQPADDAGEYYFLNAQASGTLEKELNQSAAQGWRFTTG